MRTKDAKTWIDGYKHTIYPEHIPGYGGKVPGIEPAGKKGSPIIGTTYSKATLLKVIIIKILIFLLMKDILVLKKLVMLFLK